MQLIFFGTPHSFALFPSILRIHPNFPGNKVISHLTLYFTHKYDDYIKLNLLMITEFGMQDKTHEKDRPNQK